MALDLQGELSQPAGDLTLLDPGALLIEIEYPYDESLGDPAIHYFQVVERDHESVVIAGIAKEPIAEAVHEREARKRVRPVRDAFVTACRTCYERASRATRQRGLEWPAYSAIDDARWNAYEGTGALHDRTSVDYDHAFRAYVPTATLKARFNAGEPYLRPGAPARTILCLVPPVDDVNGFGSVGACWTP